MKCLTCLDNVVFVWFILHEYNPQKIMRVRTCHLVSLYSLFYCEL